MTKPLGFFCNYTPGDGGLLGEMEASWGSCFEQLNNSERIWMLSTLTGLMCADKTDQYDPYAVGDEITAAYERFDELDFSNQVALAEALLEQIKNNR